MFLFSFLASKDRVAYLICSVFGLCVYLALRPAPWANYAGLLVTYHLYLAWLVMSAENTNDRSFSIPATIAYHIACVAVLIGSRMGIALLVHSMLASMSDLADAMIALVALRIILVIQILITYGLAMHEREWLFSGGRKKNVAAQKQEAQAVAPPMAVKPDVPLVQATGRDHDEWVRSRGSKTVFYKPGTTPADDFEQWLRARGKTQYVNYAAGKTTVAS
jgi:hypothetical protein